MYQRCLIEETRHSIRDQFLVWVAANIIIGGRLSIHHSDQVLYYLPIPFYLYVQAQRHPDIQTELMPVHGQLSWNDLTYLRTRHANPGNLYHPNIENINLKPHGYYSGASNFFRHDLYHQSVVSSITHEEKLLYAFLHQTEDAFATRLKQAYSGINTQQQPFPAGVQTLHYPRLITAVSLC